MPIDANLSSRIVTMNQAAVSPSPLNGERAGVRGEAVRFAGRPHGAHVHGDSPRGGRGDRLHGGRVLTLPNIEQSTTATR